MRTAIGANPHKAGTLARRHMWFAVAGRYATPEETK